MSDRNTLKNWKEKCWTETIKQEKIENISKIRGVALKVDIVEKLGKEVEENKFLNSKF